MVDLTNLKSVNAEHALNGTSGKYAFIPTTRVIDTLESQGWFPAKASEKRVNSVVRQGFQEHLIRFRQQNDVVQVGDLIPEIVLKNSHDGLSSFQIMAGIFRLVCSNGMIVADSLFATHRIKHIGYRDQDVIDATFSVMSTTPKIMNRVEEFKQVILSPQEQLVLAESALTAKYGEPKEDEVPLNQKFNLEWLAFPVRKQDRMTDVGRLENRGLNINLAENTLWNSFNILQEKLVEKGGRFAKAQANSIRVKKARKVTSVSENVRINQALWQLAEKMAELKG